MERVHNLYIELWKQNEKVKWVKEMVNGKISEQLFKECKLRYYTNEYFNYPYYENTESQEIEYYEIDYFTPFFKALSNCDIGEFKRIGNTITINNIGDGGFYNDTTISDIKHYNWHFTGFQKECSISSVIEIVQYVKSTRYQHFNRKSFFNLFKSLLEINDPHLNIQDIISSNDIVSLNFHFLHQLLLLFSPQIIFKNNYQHIKTFLYHFKISLPRIKEIESKRAPTQHVIKCIEILVNQSFYHQQQIQQQQQ